MRRRIFWDGVHAAMAGWMAVVGVGLWRDGSHVWAMAVWAGAVLSGRDGWRGWRAADTAGTQPTGRAALTARPGTRCGRGRRRVGALRARQGRALRRVPRTVAGRAQRWFA